MTTELWVLVLAQVPMTLAIIVSMLVTLRGQNRAQQLNIKLEEVHKATNSMKDELVEATRVAAMAAGIIQGIKEEKARRMRGKLGGKK